MRQGWCLDGLSMDMIDPDVRFERLYFITIRIAVFISLDTCDAAISLFRMAKFVVD